jgi:hypothetical protein
MKSRKREKTPNPLFDEFPMFGKGGPERSKKSPATQVAGQCPQDVEKTPSNP